MDRFFKKIVRATNTDVWQAVVARDFHVISAACERVNVHNVRDFLEAHLDSEINWCKNYPL